jgi:hypothetical protein
MLGMYSVPPVLILEPIHHNTVFLILQGVIQKNYKKIRFGAK